MKRAADILSALVPLIADLSHALPAELRYQRLLDALRSLLPCDAVALLRLEGDMLVPLATHGLSADTLGRHFLVCAHPRLDAILRSPRALLFEADSTLPDPYDGLVEGVHDDLAIHDCMGCALRVDQKVWGVLTLDNLEPGRFSAGDLEALETFAQLAAATVAANARFQALARSAENERRKLEAYRHANARPDLLIGQSAAFRQLCKNIDLVAPSDLSVLITGETGVGKELVARRLHARSARADQALVVINCAALPEQLVESELFGHVRGAFSGAISDRPGKFHMADGGTLFLDEVGELPLAVQAKLLRVLQDGQLHRVGSDREHRADVRLIAATNRDLAEAVNQGRFRADLYHRLSAFPLSVPALRERESDVLMLAGAFTEENRRRMGLRGLRLDADTQQAMLAYPWPGNVRELEHLVARSALKAAHRQLPDLKRNSPQIVTIRRSDLDLDTLHVQRPQPASPLPGPVFPATHAPQRNLRTQVDDFQRMLIRQALQAAQGNVAAAARALGLDRGNLVRLARRLGIDTAPNLAAQDGAST